VIQYEFGVLLRMIDQLIDTSEPGLAEYYRGYRAGIRINVLGEHASGHFRFYQSYKRSGNQQLGAYSRGFMDGCNGVKLEELSGFSALFRAS